MSEIEKMPELLPCPFYKNGVPKLNKSQYGFTIKVIDPTTKYDDEIYRIAAYNTAEEAITAWNTRTDLVQKLEGLTIVPIEPTPEMLDAYVYAVHNKCGAKVSKHESVLKSHRRKAAIRYRAMIDAAPTHHVQKLKEENAAKQPYIVNPDGTIEPDKLAALKAELEPLIEAVKEYEYLCQQGNLPTAYSGGR